MVQLQITKRHSIALLKIYSQIELQTHYKYAKIKNQDGGLG